MSISELFLSKIEIKSFLNEFARDKIMGAMRRMKRAELIDDLTRSG